MSKTLSIILGLVILGGIAFGAVSYLKAPAQDQVQDEPQTYGGPVSNVNYFCAGGVCEYFGSAGFNTATSTACAIQSPTATSTLVQVGVRIDTASSTATNWFIGTGTTRFATSTALGGVTAVAGAAQAFIQGSTSPAAASGTILAPNTYVIVQNNLGITSGDAGTGFVPSGRCIAKFTTPQF